ncbi:bromodomain-containing factor 1-like [Miscanthus floridulus]|uniref:bromodomain-containing factor 1-like n=1 Tax=Miscanthus floridulus TaxID=154761 RepID=UPI00345ADA21
MKRKRGRKPARKKAGPAESTSPDSASSPSTEASDSPRDQAEEDNNNAPPVVDAGAAVPEPPPPPPPAQLQPSEPPRKPSASALANPPADITYSRPKVGAVYGRVKLKFKSSKTVDSPLRPQQQDSSEAQVPPPADAGKSEGAAVPEVIKRADAEKAAVVTDGQQADGQGLESSDADKEKVARKVGGIKIKLAGLPSGENSTPDRKADSVVEPPPSKQEALLESKKMEDAVELWSPQESEEKQSTPEHQRNEKELAAALEAIKKVMKMDAADPFNVPVDPVALEIPDYFDVIDTPMDFGTVCQNLERGDKYMNSEDVYKDVQFIWDNCIKYNSKGDYIIELMKRVKKGFMKYWLAAGLYSDVPDSGGNDNTGDEDAKGHSKNKAKNKRRRPGNDRHKSDCICAVCQVTRRKKERDEILAIIDNETAAMDSNTSEQQDMEGNSGANNLGNHDTCSSQEQPSQTYVYKETPEANDSGIRMEDVGKFSIDQTSSLPLPDYEDDGSRQYLEEKGQAEYRYMNSNEEHTPTLPNEYSDVEHHQQKGQTETSQEVEMEEDYPMQQENPSFLQLCASLCPSNGSTTFRVRHSLFRPRRRAPVKASPLHVAMAAIMKR